jgi:LysR family hydrogen peroxide-inducible transcriptional activator
MELTPLRYFLAIARSSGFTAAAVELGISQSALSRSIQRLEEELGQPLFERDSRPLALTEAGHTFKNRALQIIGLVEQSVAEITDDGATGHVRVGAIPTIAPYWLPQLVSQFSKVRPQAQVFVYEEVTAKLMERIRDGELDVAIMALPIDGQYLDSKRLFDEELYLMHGPEHPLASKKKIKIEDIQPYPMLMLDQSHCLSDQVSSFCKQRSIQPIALERASQLTTVQALVSIGHGISFIPAMAKPRAEAQSGQYRSLEGTKPKRSVVMVWNPYRFQSQLVQSFRDEVLAYSQEYDR